MSRPSFFECHLCLKKKRRLFYYSKKTVKCRKIITGKIQLPNGPSKVYNPQYINQKMLIGLNLTVSILFRHKILKFFCQNFWYFYYIQVVSIFFTFKVIGQKNWYFVLHKKWYFLVFEMNLLNWKFCQFKFHSIKILINFFFCFFLSQIYSFKVKLKSEIFEKKKYNIKVVFFLSWR